jgi:Fic family protein
MKKSEFTPAAPGRLHPVGDEVVSFIPALLPPSFKWTGEVVRDLSAADQAVGRLAGVAPSLPNSKLLIRTFLGKEAVLSSRIEGTRASLEQLFLFEASPETEPEVPDVQEVRNYFHALQHGLESLDALPIGVRLIRNLHQRLMHEVRGAETAGEFRRVPVWIGPPGSPMNRATFIPPPANEVPDLLSDWEKFVHASEHWPALVRIAIAHYQFEAIHPFMDGNGRVGRLLITLMLAAEKILPEPLLYLSAFFEKNRQEYYERLRAVSTRGDWEGWIRYFLRGVREQSLDAIDRANKLLNLRESYRHRFQTARSTALIHGLIDRLFINPVISIPQAAERLEVTYRSAKLNVEALEQEGILREITGQKRNRMYLAEEIVRTIEGGEDDR